MKLSILQWNVWFKEVADNVVQEIASIDADIVCVQELTKDSHVNPLRDLEAEIAVLGYESAYALTIDRPHHRMGNGIFSKFPMLSERRVYVQHEEPGSEDFSKENRIYLETTLDIPHHNLTVGTIHLSYTDTFVETQEKNDEFTKFLSAVASNKEHFIVTGDFNALPTSGYIRKISKLLKSAGPGFEKPTWTTKPFEHYAFAADGLDWRLDYAFTTPDIKVVESKILQTEFSDHLPILITIEL
jgi:endonuclease/exonuclease/phosphatase family metal-dependent hydrolase